MRWWRQDSLWLLVFFQPMKNFEYSWIICNKELAHWCLLPPRSNWACTWKTQCFPSISDETTSGLAAVVLPQTANFSGNWIQAWLNCLVTAVCVKLQLLTLSFSDLQMWAQWTTGLNVMYLMFKYMRPPPPSPAALPRVKNWNSF